MNENHIKPLAVDMKKELEFYKSEYKRLKTECNELQEKLVVDVCKQYIDHCPTTIEAEVSE